MKVLFAGPSLHGTPWVSDCPRTFEGVECRGPAAQGDITRAVLEGASAIGLVDGFFDNVAGVWHKEILFAIEQGVEVLGAASMGALRAAECARFGVTGIGQIFYRYHSGELDDDAAVAVCHGPADLGYLPLSEPLVNVEATLGWLAEMRAVDAEECAALHASARRLFFKERTYAAIVAGAGLPGERHAEIEALLRKHQVDVKRDDALMLVDRLIASATARRPPPSDWRLEPTTTWLRTLERAYAGERPVAEALLS